MPATKPTVLKVLEGNPGKRPITPNEPKPAPVAPPMPDDLAPKARAFWEHTVPQLEKLGLATEVDGPALELLSVHYAVAVEAARLIEEQGIMAKGRHRQDIKHPALQTLRDHSSSFLRYLTQFGMTPASRSRLSVPGVDDEGVWSDIE